MKPIITTKELFGGLKSEYKVEARTKIDGLLNLRFKQIKSGPIIDQIRRSVNEASLIVALELKTELDAALRSKIWPKITGSDDIYDTGRLLESGQVIATTNGLKIIYTAPYAALVHYGGYITPYGNESAAKVYLPARPWVDAVLNGGGAIEKFDFVTRYKKAIQAVFRQ